MSQLNKPLLQSMFMTTHDYTKPVWKSDYRARKHWNKSVADRSLIIFPSPFKKFRLDYVMSNVMLFLQLNPGNYRRAEYLDRDRQYCLN